MNITEFKFSAVLILIGMLTLSGCQSFTSQALDAEGVRHMNSGKTQQAEDCFLKARSTNPNDADACYNLAILQHKRALSSHCPDDFKCAEEYYRQALDRNPSHADAYRGLAALYCDENRVNDAFALLEHWNQQEIGSVEPKIELARLYHEYNQVDMAEQNLRQALAIEPQNVRALNSMAFIYEQKGQYCDATMMYCKSLQVMPSQSGIAQRQALVNSQIPCNSCSTTCLACNTPSYPGVYSPCAPGLPQPQIACCPAPPSCVCTTCPSTPVCNSCTAQSRPIDTPSWAMTQTYPAVASQTFLGNNPASCSTCGTPTPVTQPTPATATADVNPTPQPAASEAVENVVSSIPADKELPGRPSLPTVAGKSTELY